jgi:hypothetical protein
VRTGAQRNFGTHRGRRGCPDIGNRPALPPAKLQAVKKRRLVKRSIAMNLRSKAFAVALLAAAPSWFATSAHAAPLGASLAQQDAGATVQMVEWRGGDHRGWGGGWRGGHGWWGGPAAGFAAGAIIGGAVAASQPWYGYDYAPGYYSYDYDPGYYAAPGGYVAAAPDQDIAYCAQRYRSYDPASGTYLGYDGLRHPCP